MGLKYGSQDGENRTKTDVKLVCKAVFVRFSTSGERPMLFVRLKTDKKMPMNRNIKLHRKKRCDMIFFARHGVIWEAIAMENKSNH